MQPLYGGRLVHSQMRTYLLVSLFSCPVVFVKIEFYILMRQVSQPLSSPKLLMIFVTKRGIVTILPRNNSSLSSVVNSRGEV